MTNKNVYLFLAIFDMLLVGVNIAVGLYNPNPWSWCAAGFITLLAVFNVYSYKRQRDREKERYGHRNRS